MAAEIVGVTNIKITETVVNASPRRSTASAGQTTRTAGRIDVTVVVEAETSTATPFVVTSSILDISATLLINFGTLVAAANSYTGTFMCKKIDSKVNIDTGEVIGFVYTFRLNQDTIPTWTCTDTATAPVSAKFCKVTWG